MIDTNLSIKDFIEYFEKDKLGKLFLPNGNGWDVYGRHEKPISIKLRNLFKVMSGWKINSYEVPLEDIIGIIAYGSAVKYPGYKEIPKVRRKYVLFGPVIKKMKKVSIKPNDVDFFVLTEKDITRHEYIKPGWTTYDYASCGCVTAVSEGGINLVNRGVNQFLKGVKDGDTISTSAMREGIPIFFNKKLDYYVKSAGIKKETPRKILWDENKDRKVFGIIN